MTFTLKLTLRTDLRIELFQLWRNGELEKIEQRLKDCGFGPGVVEPDFGNSLITSFKNSGYPVYKREELTFCPEKLNEHPLIRSEKFEVMEKRCTLQISPDFEKELFSRFPEISVEDGLRQAGIDPEDVGYLRIRKLEKAFEEKASRMCISAPTEEDNGITEDTGECRLQEYSGINLFKHPYVMDYDGINVTLTDSFYNETYLIADVGIEHLLDIYELPVDCFDSRSRMIISSKLFHWQPTENKADETNGQVCRIWQKRLQLYTERIKGNFSDLHDILPDMGLSRKKKLAAWIDSLPRDPWGHYTVRRILKLVDLSKSTYYELLHNENYGTGALRREMHDEEDIVFVRQVADYKGYKKGYRQISMMM